MPSRNIIKQYDAPAYYHIYNRGANKSPIFIDDQDRTKFLSLFIRHLDPSDTSTKTDGSQYEKCQVELIAYCLMNNHFHLLVYQESDTTAITQLMRSVATAYTMYFNLKYKHSGHLFQGIFKASMITRDAYLLHITRYIHMNPRRYLRYQWSSIAYYLGADAPAWLNPERVNDMTADQYRNFLETYEDKKAELETLKDQLADH